LTTPASDVVDAERISCVPPRTADCCCNSLPSCEPGNFADLQLAAALGRQHLGEFFHAKADGVIGVVEVAPADGAFLHLGGSRCPHKRTKADGSAQQSDPHGGSSRWFAIFSMSRWGQYPYE
jgi:hypothetical protein